MPPKKQPPKAKPKLADVTSLYETNFRDIPATLRVIAEQIERGDLGEVTEGALVIFGQRLDIFGLGCTNHDGGSTHLLLTAGANKLADRLVYWGEDEE
jgi:hypothetical protein